MQKLPLTRYVAVLFTQKQSTEAMPSCIRSTAMLKKTSEQLKIYLYVTAGAA